MKAKQLELFGKRLFADFPCFAYKGPLVYAVPVGHVLRGFYFEDSGLDRVHFYTWVFFLPLYVSTEHISFTFGMRLGEGSGARWNIDDPATLEELRVCIETQGIPFLSGVDGPLAFAEVVQRRFPNTRDPYVLEGLAYSFALGGEYASALSFIDRLISGLDCHVAWQNEMRVRAESLKRELISNPDAVRRALSSFELWSRGRLGLPADDAAGFAGSGVPRC
jgi:hypothetical protein